MSLTTFSRQVTEAACASPKPIEFESVGGYWSDEGWLASVYFSSAPQPLKPKDQIAAIAPNLQGLCCSILRP